MPSDIPLDMPMEFRVAPSQNQNPKFAPITQDEAAFYMIDYSTMLSQRESKLCIIPDEILLEIGKAIFVGFGLKAR